MFLALTTALLQLLIINGNLYILEVLPWLVRAIIALVFTTRWLAPNIISTLGGGITGHTVLGHWLMEEFVWKSFSSCREGPTTNQETGSLDFLPYRLNFKVFLRSSLRHAGTAIWLWITLFFLQLSVVTVSSCCLHLLSCNSNQVYMYCSK